MQDLDQECFKSCIMEEYHKRLMGIFSFFSDSDNQHQQCPHIMYMKSDLMDGELNQRVRKTDGGNMEGTAQWIKSETLKRTLQWIPIWPYAKLIGTCWLVLPYFSGAAYVYDHYVRPLFVNPQTINIWYVPKKKDAFAKPDDILTAAEKYIQENGTEAFQNMIHRADKSRRGGSSHHTMYEESY